MQKRLLSCTTGCRDQYSLFHCCENDWVKHLLKLHKENWLPSLPSHFSSGPSGFVIIISQNSSKSIEPEPSWNITVSFKQSRTLAGSDKNGQNSHHDSWKAPHLIKLLDYSLQLLLSEGGQQVSWGGSLNDGNQARIFFISASGRRISKNMASHAVF